MLKDEQRAEAAKLRGKPLSARLSYFWTYNQFKIYAFLFLLASAIAVGIIISQVDMDELNVVITDHFDAPADTDLILQAYKEVSDSPHGISFDMNLALDTDDTLQITIVNIQRISAMNNGGNLDIMISPEPVFETFGPRGLFMSLDLLLTEKQIEKLDAAGLLIRAQLDENLNTEGITRNGRTVISGIRIEGSTLLRKTGIGTDRAVIGITAGSKRTEEALVLLNLFIDGLY